MNNFIITEFLLGIILFVAAVIAYEFYISKNGILRKLMIRNFCVEVFIYFAVMIYVAVFEPVYSFWWNLILLPKVYIKLRILYYLKTKK